MRKFSNRCSCKDSSIVHSVFLRTIAIICSILILSGNIIAQGQQVASSDLIVSVTMPEAQSGMGFSMLGADSAEQKLEQLGYDAHSLGFGNNILKVSGDNLLPAGTSAALSSEQSPEEKCALLEKNAAVNGLLISCSPDYLMKTSAAPNDPHLSSLWGMNASEGIDALGAWEVSTGSANTVVAIIDTGINYNHPDLVANMWVNPGEVPGNGIDDDGNGVIDDKHGYNAINNSGNPMDGNGHGTHVAGTIAGKGNNGTGVVGVNWTAKLMGLKFLGDNGSGSLSGAIQAINYMVMMKNRGVNIRVSNNSWGGGGYSGPLRDAIIAAKNAGIIFVAAAGNSANDNDGSPSYPASYDVDNIVSVAAIDSDRNLASFSNYGASTVDIAAPGVSILSTYQNSYSSLNGTSMATPHVAGVLALLHSANPSMTNAQLIQRIYDSGIPLATLSGVVSTGRMLSADRALKNNTSPVTPPPGQNVCPYDMEEISYNPDTSADNGELKQQNVDELNFVNISLPFQFPFHNNPLGSLVISPNGVLYKKAPSAMDYRNASIAPLNSIAGLHADLKTLSAPSGVRYAGNSSKAVFSYHTKAYGQESLGNILIRIVVNSSGVIETYFEASSTELFNYVKSRATMGITGPNQGSAKTFAYNDISHNQIAVRYTPRCDDEGDGGGYSISSFEAKGRKGAALTNELGLNGQMVLTAKGTGSADLEVKLKLGSYSCQRAIPFSFSNGEGNKSIKIAKFVKSVEAVLSDSDGSIATATIKSRRGRASRASQLKNSALADIRNVRACNRIAKSAK